MKKYNTLRALAADFDELCVDLLRACNFTIEKREAVIRTSESNFLDIDILARDTAGQQCVVEWKLPGIGPEESLYQSARHAASAAQILEAPRTILIAGSDVPDELTHQIGANYSVEVWDRNVITKILDQHPHMVDTHRLAIDAVSLGWQPTFIEKPNLIDKLNAVQAGRSDWMGYEDVCRDICWHLFAPALHAPIMHSRSDNQINIRDIVFGLRLGSTFWDTIRLHYQTRIIVVECKNLVDAPTQEHVLELMKYLSCKAMRSVGILCSRKAASKSAEIMRRVAWVESSKLIIFLNDSDLIAMLKLKYENQDPTQLLDAKLDAFFTTLGMQLHSLCLIDLWL
jgi:hypothetical protein